VDLQVDSCTTPPPVDSRTTPAPASEWIAPVEDRAALEAELAALYRAQFDRDKAQLEALARAAARRKAPAARERLSEFVRQAWPVLHPGKSLEWNWHLDVLCDHAQALAGYLLLARDRHERGVRWEMPVNNLLINVPPRTGKSEVIGIFLPAWLWLKDPSLHIRYVSGNERVRSACSRSNRDLIASNWYRETFKIGWHVRGDADAIGLFENTARGRAFWSSYEQKIIGEGSDCIAGETLVSTETGDVPIADLHAMRERPRVWSYNHETGCTELRKILGSRRIPGRKTVDVVAFAGNMLRCTDDHRVWDGGAYSKAADIAGRHVSVLRRTVDASEGIPDPVREVCDRGSDLRPVREVVPESRGRSRQADQARQDESVLLSEVQRRATQPASDREGVLGVRREFQTRRTEGLTADVLYHVPRRTHETSPPEKAPARSPLCFLPDRHGGQLVATHLLFSALQGQGAFEEHDWGGELSLQSSDESRRSIFPDASLDPAARRFSLHGVRSGGERKGVAGSPCRSQPGEQRAGEPDHTLPRLPYGAPQVAETEVVRVSRTAVAGCDSTVDVYDIHVEGNHNFFAGGILVHNCIIVDDPIEATKAQSELERKSVNEHWDMGIENRVNDPDRCARMGIMQRLHEEDWSAHVLSKGTWRHVCLPMEYEARGPGVERNPCPCNDCMAGESFLGKYDHRNEGELLHPSRFSEKVLEEQRAKGSLFYAGQHQQRPAPADGSTFKRTDWGSYSELPDRFRRHPFIFMDCSAKKTATGSRTAIVVMAEGYGANGHLRYVLDVIAKPMNISDMRRLLVGEARMKNRRADFAPGTLFARYPRATLVVEDKAAGSDLVVDMREAGINVVPWDPKNSSKESRAFSIQGIVEAGNVLLPRGAPWKEDFLHELSTFPNGKWDDQVDALSMGLIYLRDNMSLVRTKW
jgi:predicted phage terminase large subunit-like protein